MLQKRQLLSLKRNSVMGHIGLTPQTAASSEDLKSREEY